MSLSSLTSTRCKTSNVSTQRMKICSLKADQNSESHSFRSRWVQSSAPSQLQLKTEAWRKSKYLTWPANPSRRSSTINFIQRRRPSLWPHCKLGSLGRDWPCHHHKANSPDGCRRGVGLARGSVRGCCGSEGSGRSGWTTQSGSGLLGI